MLVFVRIHVLECVQMCAPLLGSLEYFMCSLRCVIKNVSEQTVQRNQCVNVGVLFVRLYLLKLELLFCSVCIV